MENQSIEHQEDGDGATVGRLRVDVLPALSIREVLKQVLDAVLRSESSGGRCNDVKQQVEVPRRVSPAVQTAP